MLAAISTMGEMSFSQVKKECGGEGWVPLLIYRLEHEGETFTVLPIFSTEEVCRKWCKRNLPKEWGLSGGVFLTDEDIPTIEEKGWRVQMFEWPNKVKDFVTFDVEPIELSDKPEVCGKRK
jgi:hypothetical protein